MNYTVLNTRKKRKGAALIIALVIVVILGVIVAHVTKHVYAIHRINQYNIAREKAAMVAEAGLYKLIWLYSTIKEEYNQHYAGYSSEPFVAPMGIDDPDGNWAEIAQFFDMFRQTDYAEGGIQARDALYEAWQPGQVLMTFIDDSLNEDLVELGESKVIELQVLFPRPDADPGTVFTFKSTARSTLPTGATVERTVLFDVNFKRDFLLKVPAGIISGTTASTNGQFNLHWGEAWANTNLCLVGNVKINDPPYWEMLADNTQAIDEWTKYKAATGHVQDNKGNNCCDDTTIYDPGTYEQSIEQRYLDQLFQFCDDHEEPKLSDLIDETVQTFAAFNDPEIGYEFWKDVAIRRDTYVRPSMDGSQVYDSEDNQLYLTDDGEITTDPSEGTAMTIYDAIEVYRQTDKVFVFFIDTTNGEPPVTNGTESNWCDIKYTGAITKASRGLFYVAGHLYIGGSGQPPEIPIRDPNEVENNIAPEDATNEYSPQPVFHDGILFTFGNYNNQANVVVYGSVVTNGSYTAGGGPRVFYNAALKDGEPFQLSSPVTIRRFLVQSGLH